MSLYISLGFTVKGVFFLYFSQDCIYSVRNTWSWLVKASKCMHIHLNNAAKYHQVSVVNMSNVKISFNFGVLSRKGMVLIYRVTFLQCLLLLLQNTVYAYLPM